MEYTVKISIEINCNEIDCDVEFVVEDFEEVEIKRIWAKVSKDKSELFPEWQVKILQNDDDFTWQVYDLWLQQDNHEDADRD